MKRIGLFFGGMSNEAEISILSAKNIASNLDRKRYALVPVFWDPKGRFHLVSDIEHLKDAKELASTDFSRYIDIAFPITHGKFGEDGVLQAIFESQRLPYCGCRMLSSALCMDKAACKTLLSGHDIVQTKFVTIDRHAMDDKQITTTLETVQRDFSLPIFVKPSNSGSSVGISQVTDLDQLEEALSLAQKHDDKMVIEEGLTNFQEIELAILGNSELVVSSPGQLKPPQGFYTYDEKYVLEQTESSIPARIPPKTAEEAMSLAERAYRLCDCKGFARIDMFVQNNKVYLNEINTLPGFTDISMYPRLMQASGIPYPELLSRIIELAY